jgi:hypothetical protein
MCEYVLIYVLEQPPFNCPNKLGILHAVLILGIVLSGGSIFI